MPRPPDPVDPGASPWHLLGAVIRHWRGGLSQRELAGKLHIDATLISLYERGVTRPHADTVRLIDQVTGAGGQLTALHATVTEVERFRALESRRRQRGTVQANPSSDGEADEMERRALLQLLTALGAGTAIPGDALETIRLSVNRAVGDRDDAGLDEWEQIAHEYGHALVTVPAHRLIGELATDAVEIRAALERTQSASARAGLERCSALVSAAFAMVLLDTGQTRAAWRWWRTARRAADSSGDQHLAVWVRAREAFNSAVAGRSPAVVESLTDAAIEISGGVPSAGLVGAYANRAGDAARAGDEATARATLDALAEIVQRLPASSADQVSQWAWSESGVLYAEGSTYAILGDTARAEPALRRALELTSPERRVARMQVRLREALCLVRDRSVHEGLTHAWRALEELPAQPKSVVVKAGLGEVLAALPDKAREVDAARALRELITT